MMIGEALSTRIPQRTGRGKRYELDTPGHTFEAQRLRGWHLYKTHNYDAPARSHQATRNIRGASADAATEYGGPRRGRARQTSASPSAAHRQEVRLRNDRNYINIYVSQGKSDYMLAIYLINNNVRRRGRRSRIVASWRT